jgi:L-threonylcarbamoyladenylate synthase
MLTKIIKVDPLNPEKGAISEAAGVIKRGGLVAFPTETVYGLGGDATSEEACRAIYEAKGRESDNPLIVHIGSVEQLKPMVGRVEGGVSRALPVIWPGPVTLVFRRNRKFPDCASRGLDTVAVRMPAHRVALELIKASGVPIAAPSANRSKRPSATSADDVKEELGGRIDMILDSGEATFGIESTVIDVTRRPCAVLRPGAFTREELSRYLGDIIIPTASVSAPRAPGMKYRHYAPYKKLALASGRMILELSRMKDKKIAILCSEETAGRLGRECLVIPIGSRSDPYSIAKNLFGSFRKLERSGAEAGVIEPVEERGIGLAIMNRVEKATKGVVVSNREQLRRFLEADSSSWMD